ncbi:MAG: transcription elongation factor GreA [Chloroflexi bacterium]|nr:transcription elongation factor GreA [Chloroflexota bacterium]
MPDRSVFLTPEGLQKLRSELEHLVTVRRPVIASRIQQAKELANTVDNAEYDEAKNEQAFVEGRILTIEKMLASAVLIREDSRHDMVRLGSRVVVESPNGEREEYAIVGSAEASPRHGKISNESPVGRALLGRKPGEQIQVVVPAGVLTYQIVEIR